MFEGASQLLLQASDKFEAAKQELQKVLSGLGTTTNILLSAREQILPLVAITDKRFVHKPRLAQRHLAVYRRKPTYKARSKPYN